MEGARIHPVAIIAAVTVLLVSAMGAAALTGWLPAAASKLEGPETLAVQEAGVPLVQQGQDPASPAATCRQCGVIESIRMIEIDGALAGAAGGADASSAIDSKVRKTTAYRITLRMDNGTYRTLSQPEAPRFAVGERVRIEKGMVLERG